MKKFLFVILLIECLGISPIKADDSPLISETGLGEIKIGSPIPEALKNTEKFGEVKKTEKSMEGDLYTFYEVNKNNEPLFVIEPAENKVYRLTILSSQYKTDKNIGIGSSLAELLKAYPGLKLGQSEDPKMRASAISEKLGFSFFFVSEKPKPSDPIAMILIFGK